MTQAVGSHSAGDNLERARQLFSDALARHMEQDFATAEPLYRQALALAPERPSIVFNLARLMLDRQEYVEAEALFRQSVALAPDHENHYNLALSLARQERHADALVEYDQAIGLESKFTQAHAGRAAALEQLGRAADALQAYARSVELAPEVPGFQAGFARCARLVGRAAQLPAPALIETAALICLMAANVDHQDLHDVVAALLERRFAGFKRDVVAANFDWQKIAASQPQDLEAFCNDWLLAATLEKIRLCDAPDQNFFTGLRASLLKLSVIGPKREQLSALLGPVTLFLSRQCVLNQYAWPVAEAEAALLARLRERIAAGILANALADMDLGALGCYLPLQQMPGLAEWAAAAFSGASPVLQRVLKAQLRVS